ncbi:response regulator transcription factor [Serratia fonticola]|uniref:helix-turn-helix transcriptional regulator n=1 Tax=Serratia fonticola TaxID=47917 RepID=UPI0015C5BBCF|nr:LuxR C-terminal-related transcriptional regulator [Serratia fonticola]MBC3377818.1 response regulator transcription factor [Serratia fonticola]NYA37018.1 response regulator transcription factor [Serratia fonticola]
MKNVVLLCECSFTRTALEMLLKPQAQVFGTADVEQCRLHMSRSLDGEVDLVILSVSNYRIDAMLRLATLIGRCHPSCQVLMDLGSASIPLRHFYLNLLNNHVGLIDLTQTILVLQSFFGQVMRGEKMLSTKEIICGERLNWRECNVLLGLMKELSAQDIAKTLALNVKTISHYKRSGLSKLGARNIQDLLIPVVGRYPDAIATIQLQNITVL